LAHDRLRLVVGHQDLLLPAADAAGTCGSATSHVSSPTTNLIWTANSKTGAFLADLWVDTIALRSRAIKDLYADMNAENGKNLVPNIMYGAYAKTTYDDGKLGQPGVQAMHKTFGVSGSASNASWFNFQTYSYHSYGEWRGEQQQLQATPCLSGPLSARPCCSCCVVWCVLARARQHL
jgi:hypothetical protein